jgi:hypothetical protein
MQPIVMKNGTAMRLKELMPRTICWAMMVRGRPRKIRQITEEIPTA